MDRWWPKIECWHGSLAIVQGIRISIAEKPYSPDPCPIHPSGSAHSYTNKFSHFHSLPFVYSIQDLWTNWRKFSFQYRYMKMHQRKQERKQQLNQSENEQLFISYLLLMVPSADNLSKRVVPGLGPTICRAWSGSKLDPNCLILWWYSR